MRRDGNVETIVTEFLVVWRREPDGAWRIELDLYWPAESR
jgi:ketosteroid isomerase-like protein